MQSNRFLSRILLSSLTVFIALNGSSCVFASQEAEEDRGGGVKKALPSGEKSALELRREEVAKKREQAEAFAKWVAEQEELRKLEEEEERIAKEREATAERYKLLRVKKENKEEGKESGEGSLAPSFSAPSVYSPAPVEEESVEERLAKAGAWLISNFRKCQLGPEYSVRGPDIGEQTINYLWQAMQAACITKKLAWGVDGQGWAWAIGQYNTAQYGGSADICERRKRGATIKVANAVNEAWNGALYSTRRGWKHVLDDIISGKIRME